MSTSSEYKIESFRGSTSTNRITAYKYLALCDWMLSEAVQSYRVDMMAQELEMAEVA